MFELREYQQKAIDRVKASMESENRRVILQLATGSGKTVIASEIIKRTVLNGHTCIFLADRRKLIDQAASAFKGFGLDVGVIMAGREPDPDAPVQVATIQTVFSRAIKTEQIQLPPVDLVFIDEAHKSLGNQYQRLIEEIYPDAYVIGLTATPARTDGRGLGEMYDDLVIGPSVRRLQEDGFLVPTEYYAPTEPDMQYLRSIFNKSKGDYNESQLAQYMEKNTALIGDVVEHYKRLGGGRQAIVFAASVQHSEFIAEAFNKAGIKAAHIDGKTPHHERIKIYEGIHDGSIRVISSVMVLTEGYNEPQIEVCILARPTRSVVMLLQTMGRVLRPHPGKEKATIIDHSGAVRELGFAEDERPWSLDSSETISEREDRLAATMNDEGEEREEENIVCEECATVYKGRRACPNCGWEPPKRPPKPAYILEAELEQIRQVQEQERYQRSFYARCRAYELEKRMPRGWADRAYKLKFKESPPQIKKVEPWDQEVSNWHVHMKIREKYSKNPRKWKKG